MKRPHKQGRAVLGMTTGRWRVQYVTDKGRSVALENLFLCKNCEVLEGPEGKRARRAKGERGDGGDADTVCTVEGAHAGDAFVTSVVRQFCPSSVVSSAVPRARRPL